MERRETGRSAEMKRVSEESGKEMDGEVKWRCVAFARDKSGEVELVSSEVPGRTAVLLAIAERRRMRASCCSSCEVAMVVVIA